MHLRIRVSQVSLFIRNERTSELLKQNGFDDYSDVLKINYEDIFSDINTTNDKIMLHINEILNMDEIEYSNILYRLKSVAAKNRQKCLESFEKNSILENIINDNCIEEKMRDE
jgi:hypothetical protein